MSDTLSDAVTSVGAFLTLGGGVLYAIAAVAAILWTLIVLRWSFVWFAYPAFHARLVEQWTTRADHASWYARKERLRLLSVATLESYRSLVLMRALMAALPLLGLLGTVRGMIELFHVIGYTGTGDVRALAGGIYRATLPTMAGLFCALTALLPVTRLQRAVTRRIDRLGTDLKLG